MSEPRPVFVVVVEMGPTADSPLVDAEIWGMSERLYLPARSEAEACAAVDAHFANLPFEVRRIVSCRVFDASDWPAEELEEDREGVAGARASGRMVCGQHRMWGPEGPPKSYLPPDALERYRVLERGRFGPDTCFHYIDSLSRRGDEYCVCVYVEPVGNIFKLGSSWTQVLNWWITVFEKQPPDWHYYPAADHLKRLFEFEALPDDPDQVWSEMHVRRSDVLGHLLYDQPGALTENKLVELSGSSAKEISHLLDIPRVSCWLGVDGRVRYEGHPLTWNDV